MLALPRRSAPLLSRGDTRATADQDCALTSAMTRSNHPCNVVEDSLQTIAPAGPPSPWRAIPKMRAHSRPGRTIRYKHARYCCATIIALFESAAEQLPAPIQSAHKSHLLRAMQRVLANRMASYPLVRLRASLPQEVSPSWRKRALALRTHRHP